MGVGLECGGGCVSPNKSGDDEDEDEDELDVVFLTDHCYPTCI